MKNTDICPICEEGYLQVHIGSNVVEYKNNTKELQLHYSECDSCASEITTAVQSRTNKRFMTEFKKQVDGLLTGKELKEIRLGLGLRQADAAEIFGGGPVAFAKYEADDVAQSVAMDKLLRLSVAVPEAFAYLTKSIVYKTEKRIVTDEIVWAKLDVTYLNLSKKQKRVPNLKLISSNNICKGETYGQRMATG
jgi:HTH-type transcriptional regulator/antitoxin MqsA